jgi:hypothetical protein
VLLRDRRNDQGGMEVDQGRPERAELGIPPRHFNILQLVSDIDIIVCCLKYSCPYPVNDISTIGALPSVCDNDLKLGILVE